MIDFIPSGTPYSDVLQQIRGGNLELIQLYGPIGNVTDFVTARVIYTDENGATALYRVCDPCSLVKSILTIVSREVKTPASRSTVLQSEYGKSSKPHIQRIKSSNKPCMFMVTPEFWSFMHRSTISTSSSSRNYEVKSRLDWCSTLVALMTACQWSSSQASSRLPKLLKPSWTTETLRELTSTSMMITATRVSQTK